MPLFVQVLDSRSRVRRRWQRPLSPFMLMLFFLVTMPPSKLMHFAWSSPRLLLPLLSGADIMDHTLSERLLILVSALGSQDHFCRPRGPLRFASSLQAGRSLLRRFRYQSLCVFSSPLSPRVRTPYHSCPECRSVFGGRTGGLPKGVRNGLWVLGRSFSLFLLPWMGMHARACSCERPVACAHRETLVLLCSKTLTHTAIIFLLILYQPSLRSLR